MFCDYKSLGQNQSMKSMAPKKIPDHLLKGPGFFIGSRRRPTLPLSQYHRR
jgi:hypothetical protein